MDDARMRALGLMERESAGEQLASGLGERFPGAPEAIPASAGWILDALNPMRKLRYLSTGNPNQVVSMSPESALLNTLGGKGAGRNATEEALAALLEEQNASR